MLSASGAKTSPLGTNEMSFVRRRREHLSSTRMSQVEVQGESYLCFSHDQSSFQGNINTEDESNYSIIGEKIAPSGSGLSLQLPPGSTASTPNESEDETDPELHSTKEGYYRMVLTDHFTGLSYTMNNILLNPAAAQNSHLSLLASPEKQIRFQVENVYRGQKADMVIQRSLGITSLLGKKCLVYTGQMDITFTDYDGTESGRSWSL